MSEFDQSFVSRRIYSDCCSSASVWILLDRAKTPRRRTYLNDQSVWMKNSSALNITKSA